MYIAYPQKKSIFFLSGTVEREESFKLLQVNAKSETIVGEDRGVTAKRKSSAVPDDICQSKDYAISLKIRK